MSLIDELKWRGMIQDIMPGTEEHLKKSMVSAYIGFDPTSDSLHIGSLVPILLLVHLQKAGHKPYALVGGATGMVGDPSGKSVERNLLDEESLSKNVNGIKNQLSKFLNFNGTEANSAVLVNNFDWFKSYSFLNFIRDIGKHITVNYMMSKDSVKKRIESENGISFTEFTYQLIQGYDFYYLYNNHNCSLQMGGSDQWGNIVTGTEIIRKKGGGDAFAFTCPLITKADGGKFGKSEKGNIWLDAEKTSPFEFYQFWIRSEQTDAEKWIKIFTFLSQNEINDLIAKNAQKPEDRILQKRLAAELTTFVHGEAALIDAKATTEKLYQQASANLDSLSPEEIEGLEGIEKIEINAQQFNDKPLLDFLAEQNIFTSKGEARKMIQGGGLSINREKISDVNLNIGNVPLVHKQYCLIQKGKKSHYLIIVK